MSQLPPTWIMTSLGLICGNGQYGWTTKATNKGTVRFLRTTDITKGKIDWVLVPYCQDKPLEFEKYKIQKNDILISRSGSVGFSTLIQYVPFPTVFASYLIRYSPHNNIEARYVAYFLKSSEYWQQIYRVSTGNAMPNVNAKKLAEISIPLAPLGEQKRIADKLDKLFARIDACCDRLARIPQIIEQFRQSVLANAMSGYLTEDWREENFDVHSGDSLLKNKNFSLLSSKKEELPLLPSNWEWVALGNYAKCSRGRFSVRPRNDPTYFNGKYPFIQIGDIPHEGGLITTHKQTLNDKGFSISKKFLKGTVVIAIVGSTIGNTGILAYDMCCTDSIIAIDSGNKISNQYIELFLRYSKEDIRQISYAGGGQPNMKLQILNSYPLALPPLTEQYEIVSQIKSLFINIDRVKRHYQNALEKVEELKSLILDQAFRGELVQQELNDEPASVLLERIRAERLAQPPRPKRIPIRKSAMTKQPKESLKEIIQKLPKDQLWFDDLREQFPGNYDLLKNTLFDILDETEPVIKQVFDQEKELMCFIREQK